LGGRKKTLARVGQREKNAEHKAKNQTQQPRREDLLFQRGRHKINYLCLRKKKKEKKKQAADHSFPGRLLQESFGVIGGKGKILRERKKVEGQKTGG